MRARRLAAGRSTPPAFPVFPVFPVFPAFSVIEVVIAMALTLLLLVAASFALVSARQSLADTRLRDQSLRLAASLLEQSRAMGCQAQLGPAEPEATASANTACSAMLSSYANCPPGLACTAAVAGDGEFGVWDQQGQPSLVVSTDSRWLPVGGIGDGCSLASSTPLILQRTVTVEPVDGELGPYSMSTLESFPAGGRLSEQGRGKLAVVAPAGALVSLQPTSGSSWQVTRRALACPGGGVAAAVFPFLPASGAGSSYAVRLADVAGSVPVQVLIRSGELAQVEL